MSSLTTKDAIDIDTDITDKVVIIIDDVLYTGRTVRASLDAILLNARPIKIGLAALVDEDIVSYQFEQILLVKIYLLLKRKR